MNNHHDPCSGVTTEFLDDGSVKLTHHDLVKFVSSSHLIIPACIQLRNAHRLSNGR